MRNKFLVLCIFLIIGTFRVYSQETGSCAEKLKNAQMLFAKGQVDQVPELLTRCLRSGFSREEAIDAYKLLIQSYLLEDRLEAADSLMLAFLKKNPEYEASPTDHSSFVSLFNNFSSKVKFQTSLHIGSNIPFVIITSANSVIGKPGEKKYSTEVLNLFIAADIKYKLSGRFEVLAEIGYSQFVFSNSETINGFATTTSKEYQKRVEFPLSLTYDLARIGIFTPYIRVGGGPAINFSTYSKADFIPTDRLPDDRPENQIDLGNRRIFTDIILHAGGGIKIKTREGFIFGEVRSNLGCFNQSKINTFDQTDDDYSWYFMHGDDRFRLNTLNINFGYTRIFYKPSKK